MIDRDPTEAKRLEISQQFIASVSRIVTDALLRNWQEIGPLLIEHRKQEAQAHIQDVIRHEILAVAQTYGGVIPDKTVTKIIRKMMVLASEEFKQAMAKVEKVARGKKK